MYEFIDFLTGEFYYQGLGRPTNLLTEFNRILHDFFLNPFDDGFLPFTLFFSVLFVGFGVYLFRRILFNNG